MQSADEHLESIRARGDDHESHGCARHAPAGPSFSLMGSNPVLAVRHWIHLSATPYQKSVELLGSGTRFYPNGGDGSKQTKSTWTYYGHNREGGGPTRQPSVRTPRRAAFRRVAYSEAGALRAV